VHTVVNVICLRPLLWVGGRRFRSGSDFPPLTSAMRVSVSAGAIFLAKPNYSDRLHFQDAAAPSQSVQSYFVNLSMWRWGQPLGQTSPVRVAAA